MWAEGGTLRGWATRSPRDRDLRVSDADREATADRLRHAHGEGRLDTSELEERLERCYAAKTFADLDALAADLPLIREPEAARPRRSPLRFAPILLVLLVLAIASHGWLVLALLAFVFIRLARGPRSPRFVVWHRPPGDRHFV